MRILVASVLATLTMTGAFAQSDNRSYQQQADQEELHQLQNQRDLQRMQADSDKTQLATERMMRENGEKLRREREEISKVTRPRTDNLASAQVAEAENDLRDEISLSSTRAVDHLFMAGSVLFPMLFATYIVRRARKDGLMKYEQKFGVVLMLSAGLLAMAAIMISTNWFPNSDILQNIQLNLRIQFFANEEYPLEFLIDIATKYVLLFWLFRLFCG
jgi:hypothetical protein